MFLLLFACATPVETGCDATLSRYYDADGDGFGRDPSALCTEQPGYVTVGNDCDDLDPTVFPGAPEDCDGVDHDCDGTSATPQAGFTDADGDGFGDPAAPVEACTLPEGAVIDGTDCDDADRNVYPGAFERCDGLSNACDAAWVNDDGLATFVPAGGGADNLTPILATGTVADPFTFTLAEDGALHLCAGTWTGSLVVEPGKVVSVIGHDGAVLFPAYQGSGIAAGAGVTLEVTDLTVQGGYATSGGGISVSGEGATVSLTRVVVTSSSADQGGGLYSDGESSVVSIQDSSFDTNNAIYGGGLAAIGTVTLDNVRFDNNAAAYGGGAFLVQADATLTDVTAQRNGGSQAGGGLYFKDAAASVTNLVATENTSAEGAGVYLESSTAMFTGGRLADNAASWSGGGLGAQDGAAGQLVDLVDVEITDNSALYGGGLYVSGAVVTCTGSDASDRFGVFSNTGRDVFLHPVTDATLDGVDCDLGDSVTEPPMDGTVEVEGVGVWYFGLDADFACGAGGCL